MDTVRTTRVVAVMLIVSFALTTVMAYLQLSGSGFVLSNFVGPALVAAYYQRKYRHKFEKAQRRSIALWYVGICSTIGIIPLVMLVSDTKDKLKEPFSQVLIALVFSVIAFMLLAYFLVYWIIGMDFGKKRRRPLTIQ